MAKPNILVILVDDMGFSDIAATVAKFQPRTWTRSRKMASALPNFTTRGAAAHPRLAAYRIVPAPAGVGHMMEDHNLPGYSGRLNDKCVTIAELLNPQATSRRCAGSGTSGRIGVVPWKRGFERSLNSPAGGVYFPEEGALKFS